MRAADVIAGSGHGRVRQGAERIEPCVNLNTPRVCLGDAEGEGIIAGGSPHRACQPRAPRLDARLIECIAIGPHLKDDRVEIDFCHLIEHGAQLALLGAAGEASTAWPVNIEDTGYPSAAEFTADYGGLFLAWSVVLAPPS